MTNPEMVLVPRVPTDEMLDAVADWPICWPAYGEATAPQQAAFHADRATAASTYAAMITAAPSSVGGVEIELLLRDLIKGRDKRAADDPVRAEFQRHIDTVNALRAIPQETAGAGWRPIETAPRDGTTILLRFHFGSENGLVSQGAMGGKHRVGVDHAGSAGHSRYPLATPSRTARPPSDGGGGMSDPRFLQTGFDKQLAHLVEECGEVLAAAGKTQRWGRDSVNPLIPVRQQETNEAWLRREMSDLQQAIARLNETMEADNLTDRRAKVLAAQRAALSLDNLKEGR